MKRLPYVLLFLLSTISGAFALDQASIPPKFGLSWASSASASYVRSIPATSQIGIQNCAASLPDGFPPLTFTPASSGGCPPFGQDFNGILKQLSQWNQWQAAGGPVFYDAAFATAIGGYPKGAILQSTVTPGTLWMSTADGNATNPDASTGSQIVGGSNWVQLPGQTLIGHPEPSFATSQSGYVLANSSTIGNGSSNATGRANADTQFLFAFLWVNCPATVCPIYTSTGSASTRGATAAADFAANKAVATPLMQGAGLIGIDSGGTTFLNGVPVTAGAGTSRFSILGENLHALTSAENGPHTHVNSLTDPGHHHGGIPTNSGVQANAPPGGVIYNGSGGNTTDATTGVTINNASSGSGTGHNTVERSFTVIWMLKL